MRIRSNMGVYFLLKLGLIWNERTLFFSRSVFIIFYRVSYSRMVERPFITINIVFFAFCIFHDRWNQILQTKIFTEWYCKYNVDVLLDINSIFFFVKKKHSESLSCSEILYQKRLQVEVFAFLTSNFVFTSLWANCSNLKYKMAHLRLSCQKCVETNRISRKNKKKNHTKY